MYEKFNNEKRAIFRDMEAYALITDLWSVFSDYLIAIKRRFDNYGTIHLGNGYYIKGRKWVYGYGSRMYTGIVLYKRPNLFSFKQKILSIDSYTGYEDTNNYDPSIEHKQLFLFGIDLDAIETLPIVMELLENGTENSIQVETQRITRLKNRLRSYDG